MILNYILDYIYSRFNHLLSSWNRYILQPTKLALYCNIINQKAAPLLNCVGFVDGTILRISRPKINQNIVYNSYRGGYKRAHGIKFQNLALPNRLIGNLSGPYVGKRHDTTMLHESGLLTNLQRSAWHNNHPLCIYGDPVYPLSIHLLAPFSSKLQQTRVFIEWLFNEIKTYFKFVSLKSQMKIGLNAEGKIYCVYALLPYFCFSSSFA